MWKVFKFRDSEVEEMNYLYEELMCLIEKFEKIIHKLRSSSKHEEYNERYEGGMGYRGGINHRMNSRYMPENYDEYEDEMNNRMNHRGSRA